LDDIDFYLTKHKELGTKIAMGVKLTALHNVIDFTRGSVSIFS